jgi:predicted Ser/Thr protein kinase
MNPAAMTENDEPTLPPTAAAQSQWATRGPDHPTAHFDQSRPAAALKLPQMFGEYELLAEVARGGMGVVYRARQTALGRVVALKMILAGRLANAADVLRFRTEAEAAARLQHANIVNVFDVGEIDGQHFFTMEFIEGVSLSEKLASGPLPSRAAAGYVRRIARAVHYAHKQDIIHRDLKPSNVLIDESDEPHITDFGLAKRLGDGSDQTRTGTILGTPSYMSPEQAQGKRDVGPATDVYSLGAILYELLTGRPPFKAETPFDTVVQVIENDPVPPSLLNARVEPDLETICLKCLEKDPAMRYASADAMAGDLQRYLDGESIDARSFNVLDRLTRMLGRDHHAEDFAGWSTMLLWMAVVIGVEHVVVWALVTTQQPRGLVLAARAIQFVLLAVLFFANRGKRLLPSTPAERELWTIWIGYFGTYFTAILVTRLLFRFEVLVPGPAMPEHWRECLPYPFLSLTAGLAFFVMGADYWGRCYAFGAVFWVVGAALTFHLALAPLVFGLLWFATLTMLGLHLRRVGRQAEQPAKTEPPASQAETVLYQDR